MLNERCRVFLDLAEILSDSIADYKMSAITWIIIILIIVSILVTVTEVVLRFAMLQKSGKANGPHAVVIPAHDVINAKGLQYQQQSPNSMSLEDDTDKDAATLSDLEILAQALGLDGNATLDEVQQNIWLLRQRDAACGTPLA